MEHLSAQLARLRDLRERARAGLAALSGVVALEAARELQLLDEALADARWAEEDGDPAGLASALATAETYVRALSDLL